MGVRQVDAAEVSALTKAVLGLPPSVELMSTEGLAASLRRTASLLCPASSRELVQRTLEVLAGLDGFDEGATAEALEQILDSLVSYGDLLELESGDSGDLRRQLFLGPPSYLLRSGTSAALLIGVRPDGAPIVGASAIDAVEHIGHTRWLRGTNSEQVSELLKGEGLTELRPKHWLRSPRAMSAQALLDQYLGRLAVAGDSGEIEPQVLDPQTKATYYRGRWRALRSRDAGQFVARRPQAFGADAWCFLEVDEGAVKKLVDLPLLSPLSRAADEAWRLQAAIDATRGVPQTVEVRPSSRSGTNLLAFFSPLPSYLQRRLDTIGVPAARGRGALFCYELPVGETREELDLLQEMMWMTAALTEGVSVEHS